MNLEQACEKAWGLIKAEAADPDYVITCRTCGKPYIVHIIAAYRCPECLVSAVWGKDAAGWPLRDGP